MVVTILYQKIPESSEVILMTCNTITTQLMQDYSYGWGGGGGWGCGKEVGGISRVPQWENLPLIFQCKCMGTRLVWYVLHFEL